MSRAPEQAGGQQPQGQAQVHVQEHDTTVHKTVQSYTYQRSVLDVHREFDQLDPQAIGDACRAWKQAADELLGLADDLKAQAAVPLTAAWTSPASPDAQEQLRQAEATARALANDCMQMAHATDYAAQYAQWYKDHLPSYSDSVLTGAKGVVTGQGLTAGADAATEHLVRLLTRYNEVIQVLPPAVQAKLVDSSPQNHARIDHELAGGGPGTSGVGVGHGLPGAGGTYGTGAGAGSGHGLGSGTGHGGLGSSGVGHGGMGAGVGHGVGSGTGHGGLGSGVGHGGVGSGTGAGGLGSGVGHGGGGGGSTGVPDPYAAGSTLAGTGPNVDLPGGDPLGGASGSGGPGGGLGGGAGGPGSSGYGGGAGGPGTNGLGGGPGGLGGGLGTGIGAGALGAAGVGAGGLAGGLGSGRPGVGAGGAFGAGRAGAGAFGPGGAGAGVGGPGGAAGAGSGSGVMPMHGAGGHGEGEEERQRSTWLSEDDDVWGTGDDVPPPLITS